jgi:hypothetical protein
MSQHNSTTACSHVDSHERYDENVPGPEGGWWETGYRCKECGCNWPDYAYLDRLEKERQLESSRYYSLSFGTADEQISSLSGRWGNVEDFHEHFQIAREVFMESDHGYEKREIGPIEDKFFVFHEDCGPCNPVPCQSFAEMPYVDEWNLLGNYPGLTNPMHPEAKKAWDRRRLTYEQAVKKIKEHPNAKI